MPSRLQDADAEADKKAAAAKKPTLKINGRIHADYWNFTDDSPGIGFFEHPGAAAANYGADPEDRFFFRRIRLVIEYNLPRKPLFSVVAGIDIRSGTEAQSSQYEVSGKEHGIGRRYE